MLICPGAVFLRSVTPRAKAKDGWLKEYPDRSVVDFHYYDVLTDFGASDPSRYTTGDGLDSHPSSAGQRRATLLFVPFLNRAVQRAGLSVQQAPA